MRGVAANPSTPPEILVRLAGHDDLADALLSRGHLPPEVAAVLAAHPRAAVRCLLAAHPSTVDEVRAGLSRDPDPEVRREIASWPESWNILPRGDRWVDRPVAAPLPTGVYRDLAADPDPRVRAAVARNRDVPVAVSAALADDADPRVRAAVAMRRHLPEEVLHRLLGDPEREVRHAALLWAAAIPPHLVEPFLGEPGHGRDTAVALVELTPALIERFRDDRAALARNPSLPPDLMPGFLDEGPALAQNPALPAPLVETLVATGDPAVHRSLLERTDVPAHLLWRLLPDTEDDEPFPVVAPLDPGRATLGERLSYLEHPHPAFRRTLALSGDLPRDAVHRLATDPDWPTRLLVCERYADVPPHALAEVAEGHPGHSRYDLFRHPRLPADAMTRNARGDDPVVRLAIATRDDVPPDILPGLLDDAHPSVRRAAAANPTLAVERIRGLLDDADPTRREGAASNPALPAADIARISSAASAGPR